MRYTRYLPLVWCLSFSCIETRPVIEPSEIYEFLNYFSKRTNAPCLCNDDPMADQDLHIDYLWTKDDSISIAERKQLFSNEDINFISKQYRSQKDFKIQKKFLENRTVISVDSLTRFGNNYNEEFWNNVKSMYGIDKFNTVSIPVFSVDKTKIIVQVEIYQRSGGSGGQYIFQKKGNEWELVDQLRIWTH